MNQRECPETPADGKAVNILQNKHTIDIILFLDSEGVAREVDIRTKITGNYDTSSRRLNMLRAAGLADFEYPEPTTKGHKARQWSLTPMGGAVAKMLVLLDRVMEGEIDLEDGSLDEFYRSLGPEKR